MPAELTLHERHEERTGLERRTWLEERTWLGKREARELWVDALKGSHDLFSFFLSFPLGLCANACGEAPVGDTVEPFKCCRVSRLFGYFFLLHCVCCCK